MAHVGKLYPVAFRRDWSTDVRTFRRAMARDYFLFDHNSSGTIGGHITDKLLRAIEVDPFTVDVPRWEIEPTRVNGRMVYGFLECTTQAPQGWMQWRAEMFDTIQGSLVRGSGGISTAFGYQSLAGFWDLSYQPKPALWSLAFSPLLNWNAALWSDF